MMEVILDPSQDINGMELATIFSFIMKKTVC